MVGQNCLGYLVGVLVYASLDGIEVEITRNNDARYHYYNIFITSLVTKLFGNNLLGSIIQTGIML